MRASEYIFSRIKPYENNTAQVDDETGRRVTFDEVRQKSSALTKWLQARNFGPGNIIGLMSKNCVDYIWILLGIWDSGAACLLMDSRYTQREVIHALHTAPVDGLVIQKGLLKTVASSKTAEIKCILEFGDSDEKLSENTISMDEILKVTSARYKTNGILEIIQKSNCNSEEKITLELQKRTPIPPDLALIMSSSGTTGLPKGVMFSHENIVHGLKYGERLFERNERALGLMPFHHMYGMMVMLMCLIEGATLVPMPKFSLSSWIKLAKEFSVTRLHTVPSLLVTLIKSDVINFDDLSSVRHIYTAAAPISADNLEELKRRFPQPVRIHVLYGMSELFHTAFHLDSNPNKHGQLGRIYGSAQVKILDTKSKEALGVNSVGEICIKSPTVMRGYISNPEATANAVDEDGWLRTGDLGYCDEDGFYYFVDRVQSVIKYQGHQISPAELESVLISHPNIEEASVVGIEHEIFGQVPRAFVITCENSSITAQEIHNYMRDMVSPSKLLRGGLVFVDSMPKTSSGKIQKRVLSTMKADPVFYDQNLNASTPTK